MHIFSTSLTKNVNLLLAVSSNLVLAGYSDGQIILWCLTHRGGDYDFQPICHYYGHIESVYHLALVTKERFASVSKDGTIRVWDIATGLCEKVLQQGRAVSFSACDAIAVLPNDLIAVAGYCSPAWGGVDIWDTQTGECLFVQQEYMHRPHGISLAVTVRGYLAVHGHCTGELSLWEVDRTACNKLWSCGNDRIYSMAASPTGEIITAGFDLTVFDFDKEAGIKSCKTFSNTNVIDSIIPLGDYKVLTIDRQGADSGRLKLWDYLFQTEQILGNSRTPTGQVSFSQIILKEDGLVVSISEGRFCIQHFPEIAELREDLAEIRKNARLLAQSYRTGTGLFASLPVELNVKIAALTGELQDDATAEKIALDHFSKPLCFP